MNVRIWRLMLALALMAPASPSLAQEWTDFVSREDGFRVNFPGTPKVTETTYKSEYGADLPARVYTVERGRERYAMTVVDYDNDYPPPPRAGGGLTSQGLRLDIP